MLVEAVEARSGRELPVQPIEWLTDNGSPYIARYTRSFVREIGLEPCVSTSMALCVWPWDCYERDSRKEPELMWNLGLYARLDMADAWAMIGPI